MRVLVCGSRDFTHRKVIDATLFGLAHIESDLTVMQGGARGTDTFAREWADDFLPAGHSLTFPADWKLHGQAAGPRRNQRMLDEGKPDMVLALPRAEVRPTWCAGPEPPECGPTSSKHRPTHRGSLPSLTPYAEQPTPSTGPAAQTSGGATPMPDRAKRSPKPSERVLQALSTGWWTDVLDGFGAMHWYRFEHRAGRGDYRTLTLIVGEREIQVGVSPTGRSVSVFVDGNEA